ncbi:MAG: hypothetical protein M3P49_10355 [Actinomycetota bacterium]|nr:hypothetical protein [Actinomycetota bacterium]
MRLAMLLVVVVVLALLAGEVGTSAMEVGYVAHENNVRLALAYGIGE